MSKVLPQSELLELSPNERDDYYHDLIEQHLSEIGFEGKFLVWYNPKMIMENVDVSGEYSPRDNFILLKFRHQKVDPSYVLATLAHEAGHYLHFKALGFDQLKFSDVKTIPREEEAWQRGAPLAKQWGVYREYLDILDRNIEHLRGTLRVLDLGDAWDKAQSAITTKELEGLERLRGELRK